MPMSDFAINELSVPSCRRPVAPQISATQSNTGAHEVEVGFYHEIQVGVPRGDSKVDDISIERLDLILEGYDIWGRQVLL